MIGCNEQTSENETWEQGGKKMLGRDVVPRHYDLHMRVLDVGFCGSVGIDVEVAQKVREIVVNGKGLDVREAKLCVGDKTYEGSVVVGAVERKQEVIRICFAEEIGEGSGYLSLDFCGDYSAGLVGLYKSGGSREVYCTHFEPTDARRVFPCFDQPDMKATFSISIDAPLGLTVLSNGDAIGSKREEYGDRQIEYFGKTAVMSTYLVAFVVGELSYIEDWSSSGVRLRVYGYKEEVELGRYGLDVARRCVDYFEEYFGIPYVFPVAGGAKIDMVGIPSFGNGAMENWGLITFRRESLLYDGGKSSVEDKKNVSETVCHELGHMWFGNLVTMEWWDDLWLNEGFATWVSFKGMEHCGSAVDWDVWPEFVMWNVVRGMADDGLGDSHGIRVEVNDVGEINEIFDAISYSKGASVVRMVERYVGEEVFMRGLRRYFALHMYGNGSGSSLWKEIGAEYGEDIEEMVYGWVSLAGYPVVDVCEEGSEVVLSQSRYSMLGKGDDSLWTIPIVIMWSGVGTERIEFKGRTMRVARRSDVYKLNHEYGGFYRVRYCGDVLKRVEGMLGSLGSVDRVNVVEDVFGMSFGLYSGIADVLGRVGEYYSDDYMVARSVIEKLLRIRSVFYDDEAVRVAVDGRIRGLIKEQVRGIDVDDLGGDVDRVSMSKYVISVGVEVGESSIVSQLSGLWLEHKRDGKELGELRGLVYKVVADGELEALLGVYGSGATPGIKREVIVGLGGVSKAESVQYVIDNLSRFGVEDVGVVIGSICRAGRFRDMMVEYVVSHADELYRMVESNAMLYNMIISAVRYVSSDSMVAKVEGFLKGAESAGSMLSINKVRDEMAWRRRMRGLRDEVIEGLSP